IMSSLSSRKRWNRDNSAIARPSGAKFRARHFCPWLELLETRVVPSTANQAFLGQFYPDMFHRPLDSSGAASWGGLLDLGVAREQVVQAIAQRQEYRTGLVTHLYQDLLHRQPDPAGLAT